MLPADRANAADLAPWSAAASSLPAVHAGPPDALASFQDRVARFPLPEWFATRHGETDDAARLAALDVLMVEAFVRRHDPARGSPAAARAEAAAAMAGARLSIPPILTYPLYIRANPPALPATRRFTPSAHEFRFIRMHRLIEDELDQIVVSLAAIAHATDAPGALVAAIDGLEGRFRRVNRTVAAFRSPTRMDRHAFVDGFRPYYAGKELDGHWLEGPSGLQSAAFRLVALRAGYRDRMLDAITGQVMEYLEPADRAAIAAAAADRDAGHSVARVEEALLGTDPAAPRLHPRFGRHEATLLRLALARGVVSQDIEAVLAAHGVVAGRWPAAVAEDMVGASAGEPSTAVAAEAAASPQRGPALAALARFEAMLHGFHLEHVATTAHHIGHTRGTGGTSGVDFLLLATFRRIAPRLWETSLGDETVAALTG
jgi:tryptophan 2,3-dioxygenase